MYPGIPEYVNERGRGMYPYLTGSASWYLLTLVTEAFGVKGKLGDLVLQPKLVLEQFDKTGKASVTTYFAEHILEIIYDNPNHLDYGGYKIHSASLNGRLINSSETFVAIPREDILALDPEKPQLIQVELC